MSHETIGSLPSLAHPIIVSPLQGTADDNNGRISLQFPEIDLDWEGFSFPHLHWVGINAANSKDWQKEIALLHEFGGHNKLSINPYMRFIKYQLIGICEDIRKICEEREERIRVPLAVYQSSNGGRELQEDWRSICILKESSKLVEEIYSIRTSLFSALEEKIITKWRYVRLKEKYKKVYDAYFRGYSKIKAYDKYYRNFSKTYDAYDRLAGKIGGVASDAMIDAVFGALDPLQAFVDFLDKLSDKATECLPSLSYNQALKYCFDLLYQLDPDGSRYRINLQLKAVAKLDRDLGIGKKEIQEASTKFYLGSPGTILFTKYTDFVHPFEDAYSSKQEITVPSVHFIIVLEAIRQQLTQGVGLLCPFWPYSDPSCCSERCRSLLEKVWSCTEVTSSCMLWKRMGCLRKED